MKPAPPVISAFLDTCGRSVPAASARSQLAAPRRSAGSRGRAASRRAARARASARRPRPRVALRELVAQLDERGSLAHRRLQRRRAPPRGVGGAPRPRPGSGSTESGSRRLPQLRSRRGRSSRAEQPGRRRSQGEEHAAATSARRRRAAPGAARSAPLVAARRRSRAAGRTARRTAGTVQIQSTDACASQ